MIVFLVWIWVLMITWSNLLPSPNCWLVFVLCCAVPHFRLIRSCNLEIWKWISLYGKCAALESSYYLASGNSLYSNFFCATQTRCLPAHKSLNMSGTLTSTVIPRWLMSILGIYAGKSIGILIIHSSTPSGELDTK